MLEIAAKACEIFSLEYLGVDIVLDQNLGPLVLEVNVRPGLAVQIANRRGLRARLKRVEKLNVAEMDLAERIAFAKAEFV